MKNFEEDGELNKKFHTASDSFDRFSLRFGAKKTGFALSCFLMKMKFLYCESSPG